LCRAVHSSNFTSPLNVVVVDMYLNELLKLLFNLQVLFKLVVITVLVIAESADNCIKTVLMKPLINCF